MPTRWLKLTTTVPGLLAEITADADLTVRFQQTFMERQRECVRAVLDRAVQRGELDEPPETDLVHAMLVGPSSPGCS
ncbi:TetR-like C-terminal domain-containing protein [Nonomuraea dietziae]|uniref:TetR-like C-terminal domain-containing protein n=1 Tax=Nonomuraea dietziae TaxID=65515 RepID=UPI0033D44DEC